MAVDNVSAKVAEIFYNFEFYNIDRSLNDLMSELTRIFEANGALLFKKCQKHPFYLSAKSNNVQTDTVDEIRELCKQYGTGQNVELWEEDGKKITLLNLLIRPGQTQFSQSSDVSNYSIALVNSSLSLEESNILISTIINTCIKKILTEVESYPISPTIDKMTGTYNRDKYEETVESLKKDFSSYSVVSFVDVFSLKRMNDVHGHESGDRYIKAIANNLKTYVENLFERENPVDVFRYGGDEFVLLAKADTKQKAQLMAALIKEQLDRAKENIEQRGVEIAGSPEITSFDHGEAYGFSHLINMVIASADRRMIENKREHYESIGDRRIRGKEQQP